MSDQRPEELSASARALIDETRDLDGPAAGDRDRVKRALLATIASSGAVAASTAASGTAAATTAGAGAATVGGVSMGVKLAAVAFVAAAAVGGTAVVVSTPGEPVETAQVAERTRAPAAREPAPVAAPTEIDAPATEIPVPLEEIAEPSPVVEAPADEPEAPAQVGPAPPASTPIRGDRRPARREEAAPPPPAATEQTPDSSLRAEIALLRHAQRALADGDADSALEHLAAHARRFPEGVMVEERDAAHVVALGQAGQTAACRAESARFLAAHPGSPHRGRVANACR